LQYENYEKGALVFDFDDIGDQLYIILRGTVTLVSPTAYVEPKESQLTTSLFDLTAAAMKPAVTGGV
jgi:hypothetical protein